jgi:CheY-like chemotaxis protein
VSGLNVATATKSNDAQQILTLQKPDFILADVDMPNGFGFLGDVRADRRCADMPFIAMSEKYELLDLMRTMDMGQPIIYPSPLMLMIW